MNIQRWIAFCFCLLLISSPVEAEPNLQKPAPENRADVNGVESPREVVELHLSDRGRAAVDKAIDEVIESARQAGNNDQVAKWQSQRGQPVTIDVIRDLADFCGYLVECNELRSAQRLGNELQTIADAVKDENAGVFALIQLKLSSLDSECERYESAISRLDACIEALPSDLRKGNLKLKLASESGHAYLLGKLGKYGEAEKLYIGYLQEARKHPDAVKKDEVVFAKFDLAAMYVDMGTFEQASKWMPKDYADWFRADGKVDPRREALMFTSNVKYWMAGEKDLDAAAEICEELIKRMQHFEGVSSRLYVEAIELMARVRAAQKRYGDAEELLTKSAGIRAGLFGDDHPSVGRVRAEIDRVRTLAREGTEPVQKAPDLKASKAGDRYGSAGGSKAATGEVKK